VQSYDIRDCKEYYGILELEKLLKDMSNEGKIDVDQQLVKKQTKVEKLQTQKTKVGHKKKSKLNRSQNKGAAEIEDRGTTFVPAIHEDTDDSEDGEAPDSGRKKMMMNESMNVKGLRLQ
jgi:hypothetical protein